MEAITMAGGGGNVGVGGEEGGWKRRVRGGTWREGGTWPWADSRRSAAFSSRC